MTPTVTPTMTLKEYVFEYVRNSPLRLRWTAEELFAHLGEHLPDISDSWDTVLTGHPAEELLKEVLREAVNLALFELSDAAPADDYLLILDLSDL